MELNKYIDHTLLKPESTHEDIRRVCEEAKAYNTAKNSVNYGIEEAHFSAVLNVHLFIDTDVKFVCCKFEIILH